ncbi:hypothetical protein K503DRAFT_213314 [Rhizopogon vinicolor AM-OR11-026]|uniref:Uncharacterized protein n=1 Tax=Rhizopogon vinicolor AM-OR11-026 TaxID=1314800 RepID=A0A1B7MYT3_9AGAM|nr:hypothetical protein K503DRAFT_213314 [Rhizopogon vinicolor AM-OR11-026]
MYAYSFDGSNQKSERSFGTPSNESFQSTARSSASQTRPVKAQCQLRVETIGERHTSSSYFCRLGGKDRHVREVSTYLFEPDPVRRICGVSFLNSPHELLQLTGISDSVEWGSQTYTFVQKNEMLRTPVATYNTTSRSNINISIQSKWKMCG